MRVAVKRHHDRRPWLDRSDAPRPPGQLFEVGLGLRLVPGVKEAFLQPVVLAKMLHQSPQFRVILAAGDHETRQPWIVEPPSRLGRQEVAGRSERGEPPFEEELVVVPLQFGGLWRSRLHAVLPQDEIHGDADGRAQGRVFRESKPEDPQAHRDLAFGLRVERQPQGRPVGAGRRRRRHPYAQPERLRQCGLERQRAAKRGQRIGPGAVEPGQVDIVHPQEVGVNVGASAALVVAELRHRRARQHACRSFGPQDHLGRLGLAAGRFQPHLRRGIPGRGVLTENLAGGGSRPDLDRGCWRDRFRSSPAAKHRRCQGGQRRSSARDPQALKRHSFAPVGGGRFVRSVFLTK